MADGYYLMDITIKRGPFTLEELKMQRISERTRIWSPNLKKWVYAADLPELQDLFGKKEPQPQKDFIKNEGISFSAEDKEKPKETYEQPTDKDTQDDLVIQSEHNQEITEPQLNTNFSDNYTELYQSQENQKNYQHESGSTYYNRQYTSDDAFFHRPEELNRITGTIIWSIIVTLLCCMPLGVAGLVFAIIASSKDGSGDYDAALKNLKVARWLTFGGFILSFLFALFYIIVAFFENY